MLPKFPADATFETFPSPTEGERSHYARELWPPGPWTDEPHDKVSWVDPLTGLDCLMVRGGMGAWCGYVGVPEEHPAHGKPYNDVDVRVHGGLTFAGPCKEGGRICHKAAAGRPEVWWQGFDCNHSQDVAPGMLASSAYMAEHDGTPGLWNDHLDYDPTTGSLEKFGYSTYKGMTYVKKEVEELALQLKALDRVESGPPGMCRQLPDGRIVCD